MAPLIPYMTPDTNVLVVQNGMGVVPKLKQLFWPQPGLSPRFFHAISTHGAYKTSPDVVQHVGHGSLVISETPRAGLVLDKNDMVGDLPLMVQALLKSSTLDASLVEYPEFLLRQLEKLVVNACINPLSASLDCLNGQLLLGDRVIVMMQKVIKEAVACFHKEHDLASVVPDAGTRLSRDRLLAVVLDVCNKTAKNSLSMREDVLRMRQTEIDSINGYIVRLGRKHKVPTPVNRTLVDMINAKVFIERETENRSLGDL